jgi:hypothetical protein
MKHNADRQFCPHLLLLLLLLLRRRPFSLAFPSDWLNG